MPVGAAAAREVEVALLGRAGAVQDHDARPGLAFGQEQGVGEAVVLAELGWGGYGRASIARFIIAAAWRRPRSRMSIPLGSRLNEHGRLEVGGCDVIELAREFGTPAYVYAEDDMRARARAYMDAFRARTERFEVVYASKAFPCTAVYRLLAEEGLSARRGLRRRAAPGARRRLRARAHLHARQQQDARRSSTTRSSAGVGHIVVDSFDEIERLRRIGPGAGAAARDARHQAGDARLHPDRPGGLQVRLRPGRRAARRSRRCADAGPRAARPARAHRLAGVRPRGASSGSAEVLAGMGDYPLLNLGGGLGIAYTQRRAAAVDRRVRRGAAAARARRA